MYREAFDAKIGIDRRNPDGSCAHVEPDVGGQVIAISETPEDVCFGSGMQFCLHFEENEIERVRKVYEQLKEGAKVVYEMGPCSHSKYMFSLFDRFGAY